MKLDTSENILWISNLRVTATIAVIFIHVASPLVTQFGKISNSYWIYSNFFDGAFRFCVPVFVMLSGALLLNKKYEFNYFFKKRFKRVVIPLIFWSIIYIYFRFL